MTPSSALVRGARVVVALLVLATAGCQPTARPTEAPGPARAPTQPGQSGARPDVVTLKLASAFTKGTAFNDGMEIFLRLAQETGSDHFRIQYVGGPEVFPTANLAEAVRTGAVDLQNNTSAFYTALSPGTDAIKLVTMPPWEQRDKGVTRWFSDLHDQIGLHYLGRTAAGLKFHIYTTTEISKADLSGLLIRTTPIYKPMLEALGAQTVTTPPGEVYTALERGVVQGYGWPEVGIFDLGWHERTGFIIEPGFYDVEVSLAMNKQKWASLTPAHQEKLTELVVETERLSYDHFQQKKQAERARLVQSGIKTIDLQGAEREKWLKTADDAGWAEVENQAPEAAAALKRVLGR
jgi:TRAP-type C4-dicarboxylate transport system substrate-binding protein